MWPGDDPKQPFAGFHHDFRQATPSDALRSDPLSRLGTAFLSVAIALLGYWMLWIVGKFVNGNDWYDWIVSAIVHDIAFWIFVIAGILLIWAAFAPEWIRMLYAFAFKHLHIAMGVFSALFVGLPLLVAVTIGVMKLCGVRV